jgi:transcriptional regulator with PAS, ATPase and Fis domain
VVDDMTRKKNSDHTYEDLSYHEAMEQYSRLLIEEVLREAKGDQSKAAETLKLKNLRPSDDHLSYHELMERQSRLIIVQALWRANGSLIKAAQQLQLQKVYLARLIKQKSISIAREFNQNQSDLSN